MKSLTQKLLIGLLLFFVALAASAQTKIEAREIIEKINRGEPVTYRNAEIVGDLDLTALTNQRRQAKASSNPFYVSTVQAPLLFTRCTFTGEVIATRQSGQDEIFYTDFAAEARFQDCTFRRAVAFRHAAFGRAATFDGSRFGEEASFRHTDFSASPSFKGVTFGGDVDFRHTSFVESPDFTKAVFGQGADFRHTRFPAGVHFEYAIFESRVDFNHADFSSPVRWKGVDFQQGVECRHTHLDGQSYQVEADARAER